MFARVRLDALERLRAMFEVELERPDPLDDDRGEGSVEWSEGSSGDRARERWAEDYDELEGAPESDLDR